LKIFFFDQGRDLNQPARTSKRVFQVYGSVVTCQDMVEHKDPTKVFDKVSYGLFFLLFNFFFFSFFFGGGGGGERGGGFLYSDFFFIILFYFCIHLIYEIIMTCFTVHIAA
jgi:hypothetical protein